MKIFDNVTEIVRDDMEQTIKKGSKVSIAAACFSMYAYQELKDQLEKVEQFRFIFTSPTFIRERAEKQKREFYIPRLSRETSLYGTEFEIKLRNEMTQRSIAKEYAQWISQKAVFKSNVTGENMGGFMTIDDPSEQIAYMPLGGFTTVDIGCERGNNSYNMVNRMEAPFATQYLQLFDSLWNDREKMQDVTDTIIENIATAYNENSPEFIYYIILFHVFSEFLDDISEDVLPNEATGFKQSKIWSMLYDFQRDAVLAIINKLEQYNGCILADSVGLGKTFTALAVIKYYENRNKSVLVLCPKKLAENWNTYKDNYVNNPIASDRLNYDVLFHTDLSRNGGFSNGLDLDRLNWGNYDLVVIDESHNFRNGAGTHANTQENRYVKLMDRNDSYTITFETNSDTESWSDAFRIKCLRSDSQTPDAFINAMRTARRINCNDYVQNLYEFHDFDFDVGNKVLIGRYDKVKQTVPSVYHFDFDEGYNLRFTRYDKKATANRAGGFSSSRKPISSQGNNSIKKQSAKPETPSAPAIAPKPEPVPVTVNVGEVLVHKAWGEGTVYSVEGRYLRIRFDGVGEKSFVNPDAFEKGFLKKY